jgi:MFS family permease
VLTNPGLRRVVFASAGFVMSEWAFAVAISVYAFSVGGTAAVGLIGLIRMFPGALAAPIGSLLLDTRKRERVLLIVYVLRALMLGASAAALIASAPFAVVVVLTGLLSVVSAMIRPVEWSLLPLLARTPEELASSSAALSFVEGASILIAPAAAGVLLLVTGPAAVVVVCACVVGVSVFLAARVRTGFLAPPRRRSERAITHELAEGIRALTVTREPRLLASLTAAQTVVRGALNVLVVVLAIDLVHMGDPGVGYLTAAFGAGGMIGATIALTLAGRRRLASPLAGGLLLWGIPIALVGLFPSMASALLLLVVPGIGNAIFDLALFMLLQRTIPNDVLGRAFGALEGMIMVAVGAGSILAVPLIHAIGPRGALVAIGLLLPATVALSWRPLHRIDDVAPVPERELALLRGIPMFAPLPAVALEQAASQMQRVTAPAGAMLTKEGEPGHRFYVLAEGACEVRTDDRHVADIVPGGYFGEIALLRDVPRTATVRATTDIVLYVLDRADFLDAVTRHCGTSAEADAVVGERLEELGEIRRS